MKRTSRGPGLMCGGVRTDQGHDLLVYKLDGKCALTPLPGRSFNFVYNNEELHQKKLRSDLWRCFRTNSSLIVSSVTAINSHRSHFSNYEIVSLTTKGSEKCDIE